MGKLKIEIKNRWTGKVLFEWESDGNTIKETVLEAIKSKANLSKANLSEADLSEADLSEADLSEADLSMANLSMANLFKADLSKANLSKADLFMANLSEANLSKADLFKANLSKANLSEADLSEADLSEADLSEADLSMANLSMANLFMANLSEANLRAIKADFFMILLYGKNEVAFLKQHLIDGKIDGTTYDGECACLNGTLANSAEPFNGERLQQIMDCRDASRPAEKFFLAILEGDTPENNQVAKIVLDWITEFETLIK